MVHKLIVADLPIRFEFWQKILQMVDATHIDFNGNVYKEIVEYLSILSIPQILHKSSGVQILHALFV